MSEFFEVHRDIRGYAFLAEDAGTYPALYSTEDIAVPDKMVVARYWIGDAGWWMVEFDPDTDIFFCFAYLGGDPSFAEFGYVNAEELESIKVADPTGKVHFVQRDLLWEPARIEEAVPPALHFEWWFK